MSLPLGVAVLQHDPTVGDVSGNLDRLLTGYEQAAAAGADLVVTPELAVLGYPPRDLLHRQAVLAAEREAVADLRRATAEGPALVVGHTARAAGETGPPLTNSASVFADSDRRARYDKRLLPTYDVFDEDRYFAAGDEPRTVSIDGVTVGLTVCEDAWHDHEVTGRRRHAADPVADLAGVDLLVNLSASPYRAGKPADRLDRFARHARRVDAPAVFANQVGGADDILFDGSSFVVGADGSPLGTAPLGETRLLGPGFSVDGSPTPHQLPTVTQLRRLLELGIRDYLRKTGFEDVIVGLSGGIDSSVTAALAAEALGPEHVHGITLPSGVTAERNRADAERVADSLGIRFGEAGIEGLTEGAVEGIGGLTDGKVRGLTRENVQARARGLVLMGVANETDSLVLTPDNKSEAAVGYCTLYGDTVGALAPLGDCTKRRVYDLADAINESPPQWLDSPPIPTSVIEKAPTAELAADQTDQDDLPPYDVVDAVVERYVGDGQSVDRIVAAVAAPREQVETVVRRLTRSEFKRAQTPPALRVTRTAFDTGWRYPIAASYESVLDGR